MGDVVKLKTKRIKSEKEGEMLFFFKQFDLIKQLYIAGALDKIIILANGKNGENKCCTGNQISVNVGKQICRDFIDNSKEYLG
ncbi:MAG: hypothetical protein PHY56_06980 [Candidatus Omnitrophica bacterium]|nr:hypothetical protein [Candidatus Omnitrophota bacterium]